MHNLHSWPNGYYVHKPSVWALESWMQRLAEVNLLRHLVYLDIIWLFHGMLLCVIPTPLSHQYASSPKLCPHPPHFFPSKSLSLQGPNHWSLGVFIYSYLRIFLFSTTIWITRFTDQKFCLSWWYSLNPVFQRHPWVKLSADTVFLSASSHILSSMTHT